MPDHPAPSSLADSVAALQARHGHTCATLDALLDFWNSLTEWTTNTPHEGAAAEIIEMMEQHVRANSFVQEIVAKETSNVGAG